MGSPTTTSSIMVNYEGTTTTPPLVNYHRRVGPSASAIYLRTDMQTQQELSRLDPSKLKEKTLVLDRDEGGDDNSTIHVENGEDRIVGGAPVANGDLPMKARLVLQFTSGTFT